MNCQECPLNGRPKVFGAGVFGSLAVVGEAPGRQEVRRGVPFVGTSGRLLRQSLESVGVNPEKIWITNSVLCQPRGNVTPPIEAVNLCRPRLVEEISKCSRALLCGSTALQSLTTGQGSSILKARGRAIRLEPPGILAVLTVHPALVLRDPFYFTDFARDLDKIVNCSDNITPPPFPEIRTCKSVLDVRRVLTWLADEPLISIDLETTGHDPLVDKIVLLGLQSQSDIAFQIPANLLRNQQVQQLLVWFLEKSGIKTCGHNVVGFDSKWVKYKFNCDWRPTIDTMLAHYTLDERSRDEEDQVQGLGGAIGVHGLKTLARERYNAPDYDASLKTFLQEIRKQRKAEIKKTKLRTFVEPTFGDVPTEILAKYLAQDTLYTLFLAQDLPNEMALEGTQELHDKILVPAALALRDIELTGVLIDPTPLHEADELFRNEINEGLIDLRQYADNPEFNVNSPKQVGDLLFDKLRLPQISKRSTAKEVLDQLSSKHPAVETILRCRQKERLRSTYIRGILERVSADGRLRGEFLLHSTKTGRLSSRNPNLQNIPVLLGPVIRNAFIATPGWILVEADFSQIELRVAAWYSQDELLLKFYREGRDVHRMVASEVFSIPPEQVTDRQRYVAKYIDFGIIYGRQAKSLAFGELQCSIPEAQSYIDSFLERFEGLRRWIDEIHQQVQNDGYVKNPLGRKRRFPFLFGGNRAEAYRQAVNSPIQGLASDICLTSLIRLHSRLDSDEARILLTVHDSILFEVRQESVEKLLPIIRHEMEEKCIIDTPIPFKVDIKTGMRWGDLHKY